MQLKCSLMVILIVMMTANPVSAHFGTIIPSDDMVTQDDDKAEKLEVKFIHPIEGHYMEMVKPKQFGVMHRGKRDDLLASLQEAKGKSADQDKGVDSLGLYLRYEVGACGPNKIIPVPSALWEGIGFSLMKAKKSRLP